jgi:hypothetical protein
MNARPKRWRCAMAGLYFGASYMFVLPCVRAQVPSSTEDAATQATSIPSPSFRLRGTSDDLAIPQDQQGLFDTTVPATLTFQHDSQNDIKAHTADIFLGYAIPIRDSRNQHVTPYLGLSKSRIETNGYFNPQKSREERIVGIAATYFERNAGAFMGMATGYLINARIEGGSDHVDKSHFQTLAISLHPYIGNINRKPFFPESRRFFYYPFLTVYLDGTNYSQRSIFPTVAINQNNSRRIGAELGVAIADTDEYFLYSYRYLKINDWKGEGDVSHASQSLELKLDANGFARLVLQHDRGRPDRTFEPEKITSLKLAFRY